MQRSANARAELGSISLAAPLPPRLVSSTRVFLSPSRPFLSDEQPGQTPKPLEAFWFVLTKPVQGNLPKAPFQPAFPCRAGKGPMRAAPRRALLPAHGAEPECMHGRWQREGLLFPKPGSSSAKKKSYVTGRLGVSAARGARPGAGV